MGSYPSADGDVVVLGPGVIASSDGRVLNWRGVNYVPQVPGPGPSTGELRRSIQEALVSLPATEADRVRALVARLESTARNEGPLPSTDA